MNETLWDMAPMAARFTSVGAPAHLVPTWFAGLLLDGFALTASGVHPSFAEIAQESLRLLLTGVVTDPDAAAASVMHPHLNMPGGCEIEIHEAQAITGM